MLAAGHLCGQVTITRLPTLGGSAAEPAAINKAGAIVGYSRLAYDAGEHAFLYSGGAIYDLAPVGWGSSAALALNEQGQIVVKALTPTWDQQGLFLWLNGAWVQLASLGQPWASAVAINRAGVVTGEAATDSWATHACVWKDGTVIDLGTLGGLMSWAAGLNEAGVVAGNSQILDSPTIHAFLHDGSQLQDLGDLGGGSSWAVAINNSSQVVGDSLTAAGDTHAFLYSGGPMTDLGTLGGSESTAYGLNDAGQVFGDFWSGYDWWRAFIYQDGRMTDLGTLGGANSSAYAMNGLGQVVGASDDANGHSLAFLWQSGTMIDLNTLLPQESGWVLYTAEFINDACQIVGRGALNGAGAWYILSVPATANHPPVADAGPNQTVEFPAAVLLDGSGSSDPDGDALTCQWSLGEVVLGTGLTLPVSLPMGTHTILLTVTDPSGASAQDTVVVTVVDTTPPVIQSITATPSELSPANGKMCPVTITVVAVDAGGSVPTSQILSITSDQTLAAPGNRSYSDWQITGALSANLRADCAKQAGVRTYTITVSCTDAAGNSVTTTVAVKVKKSQGGQKQQAGSSVVRPGASRSLKR